MSVIEFEVADLRRRVARLNDEARKNGQAWKRAQSIEMALLEAEELGALLKQLTDGLRASYQLKCVTVQLVDPDHQIRHLLISQNDRPQRMQTVSFVDSLDEVIPELLGAKPWLGPAEWPSHSAVFGGLRRDLRSVALLPLMRGGTLIGSLNFGSGDPERFVPDLATDFLQHLGAIAAFALENSINRARLVRSGFTDVLTGWHNRRYLETRLREELARSSREGLALSCLMMDIDHFKEINDCFGHLAGDEVLCLLTQRIGKTVRGSDICVRYGGEEFVFLLPGTAVQAGWALAERVRRVVSSKPFCIHAADQTIAVTVSIGVAAYKAPADKTSFESFGEIGQELIARADSALYAAKAQGRNKVVAAALGAKAS